MSSQDLRNEPYCGKCGYILKGLTESSKCPECGKPLVEILIRPQVAHGSRRWCSRARLLGWPAIDIAMGPSGPEKRGHARGIIAIGDIATGVIAIGGFSRGILAVGGAAIGVVSMGGCAIGLAGAMGGVAIAAVACGGTAIGGFAAGGLAIGLIASGGECLARHGMSKRGPTSPQAAQIIRGAIIPAVTLVVIPLLCAMITGAFALLRASRDRWTKEPGA